ncbi:MAG: hypothetical protein EPO20_28230 [Betaproteobacteria bacterium]|nr:MAG: hypothetical protein EPO20_28230 [Betaproteobacteria bacterium]
MKHLFILNDPPYGTERSYNALRDMFSSFMRRGGSVGVCGTCLDARGTMGQLTEWTAWADKVLVF